MALRLTFGLLFLLTTICFLGCTKDALPEPEVVDCGTTAAPTYDEEVAGIIERTCAYSGCHLGGAPGVYNDYEGLLSDLESGRFRQRTLILAADPNVGMPPNYVPDGKPDSLTAQELLTITCWLDAGYPKE